MNNFVMLFTFIHKKILTMFMKEYLRHLFLLFFSSIICLSFVSCDNDDKDTKPDGVPDSIYGTWEYIDDADTEDAELWTLTLNQNGSGIFSYEYIYGEPEKEVEHFTFKYNNSILYIFDSDMEGSYSAVVYNDTLTLINTEYNETLTFTRKTN